MTRAMIEILEKSVDPSNGLKPMFYVQFNPTDYTRAKGAQIAEINIPGIDSPILQFVRGQNEKLTIDLWDTALTFEKGHKIAVHVTSSNFPRLDVNPNTGENPGPNAKGRVARNTVFMDAGKPSAITLPVIYMPE